VSRLDTVLGGKVEAPSFAFEISASLDSELAAPGLDRHTALAPCRSPPNLLIYSTHIRYAKNVSYILCMQHIA
jgi:hypothetical protein